MVIVSRVLGKVKGPNEAYLTPKSGVTYRSGISDINPADLSVIASLISNNADITNTTQTVYVDYNGAHYKVATGNTVTINVSSQDYDFQIIGFNHDELTTATAYGEETATGKAGITFQMVDCLDTKYKMNSSNTNLGGWDSCEFRTTLQGTIKNTIAAAWTRIMKKVNKKTSAGDTSSAINTSSEDLFLLSEIEIFGSIAYSFAGEGDVYAYWSANNTASARDKKVNGSTADWWERSPYKNSSANFCFVDDSDGTSYFGNASNSKGVSFGFCV